MPPGWPADRCGGSESIAGANDGSPDDGQVVENLGRSGAIGARRDVGQDALAKVL
jgi:hypothetical protein